MRLSGWALPMGHVSATMLAKAVQCPEAFRRRYLLHEREVTYPDRFIGTVEHATHAYNFEQKIKTGKDLDLEWMRGVFRARWDTNEEKEAPEWGDEDPEKHKTKTLTMVELYHNTVSPTVNPVAVESRFEERIPGVPVPLMGVIDVTTPDSLIERKTTKVKQAKPKSAWRFQARLYQLVDPKPVDFHVVTKQAQPQVFTPASEPELRLPVANHDLTVRMIEQTITRISDLYARYGSDQPWPVEGIFHDWLCSYCGHRPNCVAWRTA